MATKRRNYILDFIKKNPQINTIVEVGVYRGEHSVDMIRAAQKNQKEVFFYGFDLFEDLTEEQFKKERAKRPSSKKEVEAKIKKTGAKFLLAKGNTNKTLPEFAAIGAEQFRAEHPNCLFFIDGGHSEETVQSDWAQISQLLTKNSVVFFDDYTYNKAGTNWGCNCVVDEIDRKKWTVEILDSTEDKYDWGTTKLVLVKQG